MKTHKALWLPGSVLGLLALTICCSQSSESEVSLTQADPIAFDLISGIDTGIEGLDFISIEMTQGTADEVQIIYTPEDQATIAVSLSTTDNITFEANILFGPYQVDWFINASSSSGVTTDYGASNALITSEKYLSKTSADQLISNILSEKRSAGDILTYLPNSVGNTTTIQVSDNGTLLDVELDHLVDINISDSDFSELHAQYAVEYNTTLTDDFSPSSNTTETYDEVSLDQTRDMGYIIIASTDQGSMEFILSNPSFFKDSIFLSEISGENLQLIQY